MFEMIGDVAFANFIGGLPRVAAEEAVYGGKCLYWEARSFLFGVSCSRVAQLPVTDNERAPRSSTVFL